MELLLDEEMEQLLDSRGVQLFVMVGEDRFIDERVVDYEARALGYSNFKKDGIKFYYKGDDLDEC